MPANLDLAILVLDQGEKDGGGDKIPLSGGVIGIKDLLSLQVSASSASTS